MITKASTRRTTFTEARDTQWLRTAKNRDISTGPLARLFAGTTHSFGCSTQLASPARSACSNARSLTQSAFGKVNDWMSQNELVLSDSAVSRYCERASNGPCDYQLGHEMFFTFCSTFLGHWDDSSQCRTPSLSISVSAMHQNVYLPPKEYL